MTRGDPLPERLTRGPFTTDDLLHDGISPNVLRRRSIVRITRGVHAVADPDLIVRLTGLLRVLPRGSTFSCQTAALLWSLPIDDDGLVHVRVSARVRRNGVLAHHAEVVAPSRRHGLPVTSPADTFVDLASHRDDASLLACGDALLRRGLSTVDELTAAVAAPTGRRGSARARRVAALVRPGVDSPMESRLRLLLVRAGMPEPQINRDVHDSHGGWIARPDLTYPDQRLALEYDGRHHFDDKRQWENDIARRHNLENEGWVVRIATSRDVFLQPDRFAADMLALWSRRGGRR